MIKASIRMQWTLAEFFKAGGTTRFIDRMAASIGVHESRIKVAMVYEGSVIIDFVVQEASETVLAEDSDLSSVLKTL